MRTKAMLAAALGLSLMATGTLAQSGPVATACEADIARLCAGKSHQGREVRTCLETNKDKVAPACRTALETTGPGSGTGKGKAKAN